MHNMSEMTYLGVMRTTLGTPPFRSLSLSSSTCSGISSFLMLRISGWTDCTKEEAMGRTTEPILGRISADWRFLCDVSFCREWSSRRVLSLRLYLSSRSSLPRSLSSLVSRRTFFTLRSSVRFPNRRFLSKEELADQPLFAVEQIKKFLNNGATSSNNNDEEDAKETTSSSPTFRRHPSVRN